MTPVLLLGWRLADVVKDVPDVASDVPAVGATYLRRSSARRPEMLGFAVSLKKECQMYGTDPIAPPSGYPRASHECGGLEMGP